MTQPRPEIPQEALLIDDPNRPIYETAGATPGYHRVDLRRPFFSVDDLTGIASEVGIYDAPHEAAQNTFNLLEGIVESSHELAAPEALPVVFHQKRGDEQLVINSLAIHNLLTTALERPEQRFQIEDEHMMSANLLVAASYKHLARIKHTRHSSDLYEEVVNKDGTQRVAITRDSLDRGLYTLGLESDEMMWGMITQACVAQRQWGLSMTNKLGRKDAERIAQYNHDYGFERTIFLQAVGYLVSRGIREPGAEYPLIKYAITRFASLVGANEPKLSELEQA